MARVTVQTTEVRKAGVVKANVAAALDRVQSHSSQINADHGTIARHVEELEELAEELTRQLDSEKAAHKTEVADLKAAHAKALAEMQAKLDDAWRRLNKVKADLS